MKPHRASPVFLYRQELARQPLVSLATVVNLIGRTTTNQGLRVRAEIDKRSYPKGVVIKDEQMERIDLSPHEFHGDWNYTIRPASARRRESSDS